MVIWGKELCTYSSIPTVHIISLDLNLTKNVGYKMEPIAIQAVTIVDGNQLHCQYSCKNYTLQMHGSLFVSDVLLIPLGGCDLVIGIQWPTSLGTIKCNFKSLRMESNLNERKYVLRGLKSGKV